MFWILVWGEHHNLFQLPWSYLNQEPLLRVIRSPDFAGPATFVALEVWRRWCRWQLHWNKQLLDMFMNEMQQKLANHVMCFDIWRHIQFSFTQCLYVFVVDSEAWEAAQNVVVAICEEQRTG